MRRYLTFNKKYFLLAVVIFVMEVWIALFVRDRFVRPYLGDVLVVILLYCVVRSFLDLPVFTAATCVLVFSFIIESLQYMNIVDKVGLGESKIARIVIGTSFAWIDLLAYTAGVAIVIAVEKIRQRKRRSV